MKTQLIDTKELLALLAKRKGVKSVKAFAPELGVSFQYLAAVLAGQYSPGPKIAAALGYEQIVSFRRLPRKKANL